MHIGCELSACDQLHDDVDMGLTLDDIKAMDDVLVGQIADQMDLVLEQLLLALVHHALVYVLYRIYRVRCLVNLHVFLPLLTQR